MLRSEVLADGRVHLLDGHNPRGLGQNPEEIRYVTLGR
jgi:hypothetical protein